MKLSGLLEEHIEPLYEHLGNLDAVDKELLAKLTSVFRARKNIRGIGWKQTTKRNYDTHKDEIVPGEEEWAEGEARRTNKVSAALGRGSKLEDATLGITDLVNTIVNDNEYVAVIFKLDGKQVGIITHSRGLEGKSKPPGYKDPVKFNWCFTKAFLRGPARTQFPKPATATNDRTFYTTALDALKVTKLDDGGEFEPKTRLEELVKVMAQLQWAMQAPPNAKQLPGVEAKLPKLDVILVTKDKERVEKHQARRDARKGRVPTPKTPEERKVPGASYNRTTYRVYTQELKQHLAYRLNAYKNSKSKTFDSTEDMLKAILDEGYLDKLTFMGQPYNLKDQRIDLKDLHLGAKGRGESYVEYKSENSSFDYYRSPEYEAAEEELKQLRKEAKEKAPPPPQHVKDQLEQAESDEARDKIMKTYLTDYAFSKVDGHIKADIFMKHKVAPSKLVIRFVLEGGKIVPFKIDTSYDI